MIGNSLLNKDEVLIKLLTYRANKNIDSVFILSSDNMQSLSIEFSTLSQTSETNSNIMSFFDNLNFTDYTIESNKFEQKAKLFENNNEKNKDNESKYLIYKFYEYNDNFSYFICFLVNKNSVLSNNAFSIFDIFHNIVFLLSISLPIVFLLFYQSFVQRKNLLSKIYKNELTGLSNRKRLLKDLEEKSIYTLFLLNVDSFKEYNDFFGYKAGDAILKEIAKRLQDFLKFKMFKQYKILLYKMQVDEFSLLVEQILTKAQIEEIVKNLKQLLNNTSYWWNGTEIPVSVTIGISSGYNNLINKTITNKSTDDTNNKNNNIKNESKSINKSNLKIDQKYFIKNQTDYNFHTILAQADMALKQAKVFKYLYLIYSDKMKIVKQYGKNIDSIQMIRDAIKDERIVPFFQPIYNNKNQAIEKYECLIRLIDKNNEIITPKDFLSISKKAKLYNELSKIMIDSCFEYVKAHDYELSINLGVEDILNREMVQYIQNQLQNLGTHSKKIVFEIVESEGIKNFNTVSLFINKVKKYGCKIAIDDFGTGYSNFTYLLKLNIDYLKIDASIIRNIDKNYNSRVIAETMVQFCTKMNIETVAEFVSNSEIFEIVKSIGVDYIQGFYIGKPIHRIS